jgi:hypothetical protein
MVEAAKRIQLNVLVEPSIMLYPNVTRTMFPVMWFEEVRNSVYTRQSKFLSFWLLPPPHHFQFFATLVGLFSHEL